MIRGCVPALGRAVQAIRSSFGLHLRPRARSLLAWLRRRRAGGDGKWWESAGGLVFDDERKVALIRQGRRWTLPKGRRDAGEDLAATARREVLEETGLRARIVEYVGIVEGLRHETHFFLTSLEARDGIPDGEVDEVSFVSRKKARRLLRSGAERRLLGKAMDLLDRRAAA
jgi:8-oxo-dGTP diphosphatase